MRLEKLGAGVFLIEDFLSKQECDEYIKYSEEKNYEVATINAISGPEINKEIRHNDRVIFDDTELAKNLFFRAKECLPATLDNWWLTGFNERFRFYRYKGEHYFKWHRDGAFIRSDCEESMLTFLIYLNDDFEQGHTEFSWEKVKPKTGMALVFPHRLTHRATSPINGTKYILRTDVMYRENA